MSAGWKGRLIEQFYGPLAWAYDPGVFLIGGGLWYRWAFAAARFIEQQPVLEVGCGTGHLLKHLARKGTDVIGVDSSRQMVSIARARLRRARLPGRVIRADARVLPLADASVGTVINTFPAGYVLQEATWREYARVLRPGGLWIVVSGPALDRFQLRLIGLYAFRLFEYGFKRSRARGVAVKIPEELFRFRGTELVPTGPTRVAVKIFRRP